MADVATSTPTPSVSVTSVDSSSVSRDGELIKLGFTLVQGGRLDAVLPAQRAGDLLVLAAAAAGTAAQRRTGRHGLRHFYPAKRWHIESMQGGQAVALTCHLAGGPELCFRLDRSEAQRFLEVLATILGAAEMPAAPPQDQKH